MVTPHVVDNCFVHFIPTNSNRTCLNNASKRYNCNFRSSSTNINNQRTSCLGHWKACANCSCHWLIDKKDLSRPSCLRSFLYCTTLNCRRSRRHTNYNLWASKSSTLMNLLYKIFNHFLGNIKISNNPITQRSDCFDISRSTTQHNLCLITNSKDLFFSINLSNCYNRRLILNDSRSFDINQSISSA